MVGKKVLFHHYNATLNTGRIARRKLPDIAGRKFKRDEEVEPYFDDIDGDDYKIGIMADLSIFNVDSEYVVKFKCF